MRSKRLNTRKQSLTIVTAMCLVPTLGFSFGGCGGSFLGLQDYQRDLLFGVGGGLAGALITANTPSDDGDAALEQPGSPGPVGPQGPPGPPIFATFVDTFFGGVADDVFGVVPMRVDEPSLGGDAGPLAFSVAVPSNFAEGNPLGMRLVLFRNGPCDGGCFIFTVDGRRAQMGDSEVQCFGGEAADCSDGTRWVLLDGGCEGAEEGALDQTRFLIIDLPLGEGGLGYPGVMPGDLLAFELSTAGGDGGTYSILGVEFSDAGASLSVSATVYSAADGIPEECGVAP